MNCFPVVSVSVLVWIAGSLSGCATHYNAGYVFQPPTGSATADVRDKVFKALEEVCREFGFVPEVADSPYASRFYRNSKVHAMKGSGLEGEESRVQVGFSLKRDGIGIWDPQYAEETPFVRLFRTELEAKLIEIVGLKNIRYKRDRVITLGP